MAKFTPEVLDAFVSYGLSYCYIVLCDRDGLSLTRKGDRIMAKNIVMRAQKNTVVLSPTDDTSAFLSKLVTLDSKLFKDIDVLYSVI